jgi:hypothetical protein
VAALVPLTNADLETVSLSSNRKFLALIGRSRVASKTKGGLCHPEPFALQVIPSEARDLCPQIPRRCAPRNDRETQFIPSEAKE